MRRPELLAPVGNMECLYSAVSAGCDAVYLSGKLYGARSYAGNFDDEELVSAIKYCHLYGVKIYVTVNTLIYDSEVNNFMKYIDFLYKNVQNSPMDANAYYEFAYELHKAGKIDDSITYYNQTIKLDKTKTDAYINLSQAYRQKKDYANAYNVIKKAIPTALSAIVLILIVTVLNMFGLEYDPNTYIGTDVFSSQHKNLLIFEDYSWYDGTYYSGYRNQWIDKNFKEYEDYVFDTITRSNLLLSNKYYDLK